MTHGGKREGAGRKTSNPDSPLTKALREARIRAGLSGQQLAARLGWAQARISRIETGVVIPSPEDLEKFLVACGAPTETRKKASELRSDAVFSFKKGHGEKLDVVAIQQEVGRLVGSVEEILSYTDQMIPGLLQTPEYTAALFRLGGVLDPRALEKAIEVRQGWRKTALSKAKSLKFVIGEAALVRPYGTALPGQQDSLARDSSLANVDIRVLANDVATRVIPMHFFTVFGEALVMVENFTQTITIRDKGEVGYYREIFQKLAKDTKPYQALLEVTGKATVKVGAK